MWMVNTAAAAMMIPIAQAVLEELKGSKKEEKEQNSLVGFKWTTFKAELYRFHMTTQFFKIYWHFPTSCIVTTTDFLKGSQLGTFCPWAIVYCYIEFNLCSLNNLKLFSLGIKELFEPIVLRNKKKGDRLLFFLKAFSWETDLWVTLGDFTGKTQNWERKSVFNWKSTK